MENENKVKVEQKFFDGNENSLYVYFPTEHKLRFGFLLHADFDIEQNRKHIRKQDKHYKDIISKIGDLSISILEYFKGENSKELLEIFVPFPEPDNRDDNVFLDIWNEIKKRISNENFIPIFGVKELKKPYEVKYVNDNFENFVKYIQENRLIKDPNKIKSIKLADPSLNPKKLYILGAERISNREKIFILNAIEVRDLNSSIEAVKIWLDLFKEFKKYEDYEDYIEELNKALIWINSKNQVIPLDLDKIIFLSNPNLNNWIEYEVLHSKLIELLNSDSTFSEKWNEVKSDPLFKVIDPNDKRKICKSVIDHLADKDEIWWKNYGFDCLTDLKSLIGKDKYENFELIYVPIEDGGWKPAEKVYASQTWGVAKEFAEFWKNIEDRYLLLYKDKWEVDIQGENEWEEFLENIGVLWIPKIKKVENDEFFSLENINEDYYRRYGYYEVYRENFIIEYFPDCVLRLDEKDKLKLLKDLIKKYEKHFRVEYKRKRKNKTFQYSTESYLYWQLNHEKILTFNKDFLLNEENQFSLDECYLFENTDLERKWKRIIPVIDLDFLKDIREKLEYLDVFYKLKIKSEIPYNKLTFWEKIISRLEMKIKYSENKKKYKELAKFIYRELLRNNSSYLGKIKVLTLTDDFLYSDEVYYIDDPRFVNPELINELNKKDIPLFILNLNDAVNCEKVLEMKPISQWVDIVKINTGNNTKNFNDHKNEIFLLGLKVFLKGKIGINDRKVDKLRDLSILVDKEFSVELKLKNEKETFRNLEIPFYFDKVRKILFAKDKDDVPIALSHILNIDESYSDNIDRLLNIKNKEEMKNFLKKRRISEDYFDELKKLKEENHEEQEISIDGLKGSNHSSSNISNLIDSKSTRHKLINDNKRKNTKSMTPKENITQLNEKNKKSSRGKDQIERIQGDDGEEIVFKILEEEVGNEWDIDDKTKNTNEGADFILKNKTDNRTYFIEVKALKNIQFFISENQVNKAKEKKDKYILALVFLSENQEDPKIIWISDPYNKLRNRYETLEITAEYKLNLPIKLWENPFSDNEINFNQIGEKLLKEKMKKIFKYKVKLTYEDAKKIGSYNIESLIYN